MRYVQLLEQQQARSILGMSAGGPAAGGQQGGGGAVGCPLAEVLPLGCLLAPVGRYKGAITRALEEQMLAEVGWMRGGGLEDRQCLRISVAGGGRCEEVHAGSYLQYGRGRSRYWQRWACGRGR